VNTVKIPNKILVGGHWYKVGFSDKVHDRNSWGQADHRLQVIRLSPRLRGLPILRQTLLHELVHTIDWVYCHNELEEGQVANLSEGLHQIFEYLGIDFDFSEIEDIDD